MESAASESYKALFDDFVEGHLIDADPTTWSPKDVSDWRQAFYSWEIDDASSRE